jgi:hypothetical protein
MDDKAWYVVLTWETRQHTHQFAADPEVEVVDRNE